MERTRRCFFVLCWMRNKIMRETLAWSCLLPCICVRAVLYYFCVFEREKAKHIWGTLCSSLWARATFCPNIIYCARAHRYSWTAKANLSARNWNFRSHKGFDSCEWKSLLVPDANILYAKSLLPAQCDIVCVIELFAICLQSWRENWRKLENKLLCFITTFNSFQLQKVWIENLWLE